MPFGMKNGPSTFQRVVTKAFKEYVDIFMKTHLDDFIVYNDTNSFAKAQIMFLEVQRIQHQFKPEEMHFYGVL